MIWFGISVCVPVRLHPSDLDDHDISNLNLMFVDPCTNQGVCVDCALGNVSQTSPSIIGSNLRPGFPGCGWCTSTNSCFSSSKAASCPGPASNFRNNLTANANPCSTARMYRFIIIFISLESCSHFFVHVTLVPCNQVYSCSDCLTSTQSCSWCASNATTTG